jgi:hypothetical protein
MEKTVMATTKAPPKNGTKSKQRAISTPQTLNLTLPTPAVDKVWTTVGSAGALDEASVGKVFFNRGIVQMGQVLSGTGTARAARNAIIPQATKSAVIRYNVTPVDGLFTLKKGPISTTGSPAYKLTLRYLASGSQAQVVAKLVEINMANGAETVRLTFNGTPTSNRYEVKSGDFNCGPNFSFDFRRKAYYIEATLTAADIITVGSAAGIQIIKIETDFCLG